MKRAIEERDHPGADAFWSVALREKKPVALIIPDQDGPNALGTPLMPNAALLIHDASHAEEARHFIAHKLPSMDAAVTKSFRL